MIVPEAPLESTDAGPVPAGDGWFVLGAREGRWRLQDGLGARLSVEGDTDFPQVGINLYVLGPGEPIGMYHWEATQVWGGYSVDEVAQRHGAGVDRETSDADVAYAHLPAREWTRYHEGWLDG